MHRFVCVQCMFAPGCAGRAGCVFGARTRKRENANEVRSARIITSQRPVPKRARGLAGERAGTPAPRTPRAQHMAGFEEGVHFTFSFGGGGGSEAAQPEAPPASTPTPLGLGPGGALAWEVHPTPPPDAEVGRARKARAELEREKPHAPAIHISLDPPTHPSIHPTIHPIPSTHPAHARRHFRPPAPARPAPAPGPHLRVRRRGCPGGRTPR